MFITIEGCEGAGKSTLLEGLKKAFEERQMKYVSTREPGGTLLGQRLRQILLKDDLTIYPKSELLLLLADRLQHMQDVIFPALNKGHFVLCDRFHDSTIAYQGGGRELGVEWVLDLCMEITDHFIPDKTLYLDIDPEIGFSRKHESLDRIEKMGMDFHRRVRDTFLQLAQKFPDRIVVLQATDSKENILKQALDGLAI